MEMSLFPLSAVLLPYGRMPLRIFERRYVDLVRDSMRSGEGFGIVHIGEGPEVGTDQLPKLAPIGTVARIIDWDQLKDGLLGITVTGEQRFRLGPYHRAESGLIVGEAELLPPAAAEPVHENWSQLAELLEGLEAHPHVQRIGIDVDRSDGWQLAYALIQILPLDEGFKAALLTLDELEPIMEQLNGVLSEMGGES